MHSKQWRFCGLRLSQQVAIITGASSGIGLAAAQLFAREGWAPPPPPPAGVDEATWRKVVEVDPTAADGGASICKCEARPRGRAC